MTGRAWVEQLPVELESQRRLLQGLLSYAEGHDEVTWLVVGCSLARGNADALSDVDAGMGVHPGEIAATLPGLKLAMTRLGESVACFDHDWGLSFPHRRVVAFYADRTCIDLVVSSEVAPGVTEAVVLYDRAGVLREMPPTGSSSEEAASWYFRALENLFTVGKYLRRGSLFESLRALEEARRNTEQLWAHAAGLHDAHYGIFSLGDAPSVALPEGFERSVARAEHDGILIAARYLASLLTELAGRVDGLGAARSPALEHFVADDLANGPY